MEQDSQRHIVSDGPSVSAVVKNHVNVLRKFLFLPFPIIRYTTTLDLTAYNCDLEDPD